MRLHEMSRPHTSLQLTTGDLQTSMTSSIGATIDRPTSAPAANAGLNGNTLSISSTLSLGSTAAAPPLTPTLSSNALPTRSLTSPSKGKGMQLGATKMPSIPGSIPDWAEEAAAEFETSQSTNPWGNDDLMDVNADDDDWSACPHICRRGTAVRSETCCAERDVLRQAKVTEVEAERTRTRRTWPRAEGRQGMCEIRAEIILIDRWTLSCCRSVISSCCRSFCCPSCSVVVGRPGVGHVDQSYSSHLWSLWLLAECFAYCLLLSL